MRIAPSSRTFSASARVQFTVLAVAFAATATWLSARTGIWQDEWYSLHATAHGVAPAVATSVRFEGIPPLYPIVLALWREIGDSVFVARGLSLAFGLLALAGAFRIAVRSFSAVPAIAFVAAFALETVVVFASFEIRLYAAALCIAVWTFAMFLEGYAAERPSTRARVAHALLAVAGIYTQYFLGVQLAGEALALLVLGERERLRAYAMWMLPVVALSLPALLLVRAQLGIVRVPVTPRSVTREAILGPLGALRSFVLPHDFVAGRLSRIVYALGSLAALALLVVARPRIDRNVTLGAVVLGTILAFYLVAPSGFHQSMSYPRHIVVAVAPTLFFAFALFDAATHATRAVRIAAFALYAAFALPSLVAAFGQLAKPGDFARVGAYLTAHASANEAVLVFDQEMVGPLAMYDRAQRLTPLPAPMTFDRFDARAFVIRSQTEASQLLARAATRPTFWLYLGGICTQPVADDPFGCAYLEGAIAAQYDTLDRREFYRATLYQLRPKRPA